MGLRIVSHIHQVEDIDIDIAACNKDLRKSDFNDIYEDMEDSGGFLKGDYPLKIENDKLSILESSDGYIEGWSTYTVDRGHMIDGAKIIAKHLKQGKIVFYQEIEGNMPIFYIVTPGKVAELKVADMRF